MNIVLTLTRRNLLVFVRDPLSILFSLLGPLILFLLYKLFLGELQVASIIGDAPDADLRQVHGFVDAWMFGGIVALSTMTTPLSALSVFMDDAGSNRFRDFLVSPIKRSQLVFGYLLAAFTVGLVMSVLVLAFGLLYLGFVSGVVPEVPEVASALGSVLLSTAAFTAMWALVVSFLRTNGAFSAVSTIVGTVVGFVAGAYIPLGLIPEAVRSTLSAFPFAQSTMLLRQSLAADSLSTLLGSSVSATDTLNEFYGIDLTAAGWAVPTWYAIGLLALVAIVFTVLAAVRVRRRIR